MLSSAPAFTGKRGSVDLFQLPTKFIPPQTGHIEASAVTPMFEGPEVTVSSHPFGNPKCKRSIE